MCTKGLSGPEEAPDPVAKFLTEAWGWKQAG